MNFTYMMAGMAAAIIPNTPPAMQHRAMCRMVLPGWTYTAIIVAPRAPTVKPPSTAMLVWLAEKMKHTAAPVNSRGTTLLTTSPNRRKVVTAREFTTGASLIVANQPTRGIDIGASDCIRRRLVDLRTAGAGVLLISADLNEVLEVSDSLIVMHNGRIAAYFPDASKVTEEELGEYMLGVKTMSPEEVKEVADCE